VEEGMKEEYGKKALRRSEVYKMAGACKEKSNRVGRASRNK
jgi:hypothetical protein